MWESSISTILSHTSSRKYLSWVTMIRVFLDAFKNGTDIHTKTASVAFGVSPDMVTPEMRRTAKV
ncbi:MAG: hypothetical protein J6033_07065, partial [Lachnospiraceae bacterium]|nr:hypothetical protein [Lachnospiraceae bacterium]